MRPVLLKCFSFLDFICLVFLGMQLWLVLERASGYGDVSDFIYPISKMLTFLFIAVSWIGLFFGKIWGIIAYYIQFPFRIALFIYSIGFVTLLPEAFGSYEQHWYEWLLGSCVFFEFLRLYLTVQYHRLHRQQLHAHGKAQL